MNNVIITQGWRRFIQSVNHTLWPALCLACKEKISEHQNDFCLPCTHQILASTQGHYCPSCGKDVSKYAIVDNSCPKCFDSPSCLDGIARVGIYEDTLRKMILAFKNSRTEFAKPFGTLANAVLTTAPFYDQIELIVPVPLHWSKRLTRGYNQSLLLAKKITHTTAAVSTELVRIKKTRPQPTMATPSQRAKNVEDAFAVRNRHPFHGKTVCLIDDIKTSGATLNECTKTLKQAGAKKVFAFVLTVASQNTP